LAETKDYIPFNRPYASGKELAYPAEAQAQQRNCHLSGDHQWIEERTGWARALLTFGDKIMWSAAQARPQ
jgi:dTDP-4-amino-4,6-dideoxygalactose transaminase